MLARRFREMLFYNDKKRENEIIGSDANASWA